MTSRGRLLSSWQPRPDLSAFIHDGRTEAIAWVGDRPAFPQEMTSGKVRRSSRPDLSAFVEGSTDAIAWAWDEPMPLFGSALERGIETRLSRSTRRSGNLVEPVGLPEVDVPDLPPLSTTFPRPPEVVEWCPPWMTFAECHPVQDTGLEPDPCDHPLSVLPERPDLPFDPPSPDAASKDEAECQRAVKDIEKNEPSCSVPPVGSNHCEVCDPSMISTVPRDSLVWWRSWHGRRRGLEDSVSKLPRDAECWKGGGRPISSSGWG